MSTCRPGPYYFSLQGILRPLRPPHTAGGRKCVRLLNMSTPIPGRYYCSLQGVLRPLRPPHKARESTAKTRLDLGSQEKGPTLPNDKKLRFLIEKLSKSMREKSGWDFLEFGSREQGSPGELGAPRSSWSQIELEIFRNNRKNQELLRNIKIY